MRLTVRSLIPFVLLFLLLLVISSMATSTQAQWSNPPSERARGMVYDGLTRATSGPCAGSYEYTVATRGRTRTYCTHGPDAAPLGQLVTQTIAPLRQTAAPQMGTVQCDGDGVTGDRVQVLYVHASDVVDQYAPYLASFQQWISDADAIFGNSAAKTGGSRHVRWVTDGSCVPVIPDVTVSPTGDDSLSNMVSELRGMGYNRTDYKYLVFADAHVYCGISTTALDDQPGPQNANNFGNTFGRVDAGCWGAPLAAHELMHQFGSVQPSAPHSDGAWHCTDGYDNMCSYGGSPAVTYDACPDPSGNYLFDCNDDDYFSTNPPANSYLATHWNSANSIFFIGQGFAPTSATIAKVDSIVSGKQKGKNFSATNNFRPGDTVVMRVHAVEQNGADLSGVSVTLPVLKPDGSTQCALSIVTGSNGIAQGACQIPRSGPKGTWKGNMTSFGKSGYQSDVADSVVTDTFTVQ